MIEAACHCGSVKLEIENPPTELTSCNCSLCHRLGTLWAYYPIAQVRVLGETTTYRWGDKTIDFHRCATCGCATHWSLVAPAIAPEDNRFGVNARLMPRAVIEGVRIRRLDGADTWKFLDE